MKKYNLEDYFKGWFIGNFEPSLFKTNEFEISIKRYKKDDFEKRHKHLISTEYTIIVSGEVEMNNEKYYANDIIVIEPNDSTDFKCLTDTVTCVVKIPCIKNDKYEINIT
jgi:hypothetical protein